MRIGELAALLGVSTRTVRRYHRQGVLPEPSRRANGYREYGLRDAIVLARVRRLVELGRRRPVTSSRTIVPSSEAAAAWDRDVLVLLDGMTPAPDRERSSARFATPAADPAMTALGHDFYRRLDEPAGAAPDDARIEPLASALAAYTTEHLLTDPTPGPPGWSAESVEPFLHELAPAQAEVIRQVVRLLTDRKVSTP
ncbi:MerR family transcriptional regulator [Nonomuraea sp. NPDC049714]|uniref:MerR family transcriptional regulator n=1 Tax=Nonomuraea sp. NPDC049714 TaxID=3364357 RepID=UPI0037AEAB30